MLNTSATKQFLPFSYFHTIILVKPVFLQKNFPELTNEPLFTANPFPKFKEVLKLGIQQGYLTNITSPVKGIKQFSIHPLLRQQCLKTLQQPDNQKQRIDIFFIFIEYQYRIIYLLNEWVNHSDWQQAQIAHQILAIEAENIRTYFDNALKDNQSFLGALGLLNIHYQLINKLTLRKKILNKVSVHYEATAKAAYDIEIYEEYRQAFLFVGDAFFDDQQFEDALKQYATALQLFKGIESTDEEWVLLLSCQRRIAITHYELRNFEQSESILLQLVQQLETIKNPVLLVSITQALSVLSAERHRDFEQASWWINKGLEQLQGAENFNHKIALHQALGNLYLQFDAYEKAKQEWLTALALYHEMGDEKSKADIHNNLGTLYFTLGNNQAAKKHYKQALAYYLPLEDEFLKAELLSNLGATSTTVEEVPEHQNYFQQALTIYQKQQNPIKIAQVYQGLGSLEESLENYQASEAFYDKALTLFREYEEEDSVGELLHNLGHLHFVNKNLTKSEKYLRQALEIYQKIKDKSGIAEVYQNLGNLAYEREEDDIAKTYFEKALNTFIELGDSFLEASVRWNLGILFENQKLYPQALKQFSTALNIFQSFQSGINIIETTSKLAEIQLVLKHPVEALHYLNIGLITSRNLGKEDYIFFFTQQINNIKSTLK